MQNILYRFVFFATLVFPVFNSWAETRIAVLDFELKDLTLAPRIPAEIKRTASIKPLLEKQLKQAGYKKSVLIQMFNKGPTAGRDTFLTILT